MYFLLCELKSQVESVLALHWKPSNLLFSPDLEGQSSSTADFLHWGVIVRALWLDPYCQKFYGEVFALGPSLPVCLPWRNNDCQVFWPSCYRLKYYNIYNSDHQFVSGVLKYCMSKLKTKINVMNHQGFKTYLEI